MLSEEKSLEGSPVSKLKDEKLSIIKSERIGFAVGLPFQDILNGGDGIRDSSVIECLV